MITIIQIIQPEATNRPTVPVAVKFLREEAAAFPRLGILDTVFGWFNAGSGSECPEFVAADMRSLSAGDYVTITTIGPNTASYTANDAAVVSVHRCDKVGWADVLYEEMLDDISAKRNMPDWMANNMTVEDFA